MTAVMVFSKFSPNISVTRLIVPLCILLITFVIYIPSLKNGFVNFDDYLYVYENPNIQKIDLKFFKWIFTAEANTTWHPLTLLSIAVDYSIWGLNPFGYHLINVVFHAINTVLVFLLFIRLSTVRGEISIIPAAIASLLFGIHPLHVESVAWISERKDVLCAFFYLLSIFIYLKYISTKRKKFFYYTLCLFFFILALMSKPMAVTLPVVILILDFYPLERLNKMKDALPLLIEKIPFLILSLILSIITINFHQTDRVLKTLEQYPLIPRILVALSAYIFYLIKMVFPYNLAPFYPLPAQTDIFTLTYLISGFTLAALTVFSILAYKKNKVYLAVWGYYLVSIRKP